MLDEVGQEMLRNFLMNAGLFHEILDDINEMGRSRCTILESEFRYYSEFKEDTKLLGV